MAAYSLYEVLHTLIDRVGFPTEEERRVCHASVTDAERMGILGNLAQMMACTHDQGTTQGRCNDCGKIIHISNGFR